jgi:hypothetical protein
MSVPKLGEHPTAPERLTRNHPRHHPPLAIRTQKQTSPCWIHALPILVPSHGRLERATVVSRHERGR